MANGADIAIRVRAGSVLASEENIVALASIARSTDNGAIKMSVVRVAIVKVIVVALVALARVASAVPAVIARAITMVLVPIA